MSGIGAWYTEQWKTAFQMGSHLYLSVGDERTSNNQIGTHRFQPVSSTIQTDFWKEIDFK